MVKNCIQRSKLKLQKHQVDVVEYLQKERGVIAAYSVGVGKTLIGVTSSQCFLDANPKGKVVVVTPKSLQENFKKELKAYGVKNTKNYLFYTMRKFATTYNKKAFSKNTFLIIDEAHNLRTMTSQLNQKSHIKKSTKPTKNQKVTASKVAIKVAKEADKVLLLTATPLLNTPLDLINLVAMVKGTDQLTKNEFKRLNNKQLCEYFRNTIMFYKNPKTKDYPTVKEHQTYITMTKEYYKKYRKIETKRSKKFRNPFVFLTGLRQATNVIDPCLKCEKALEIINKGQQTLVYSAFISRGIKLIQDRLKKLNIKYVEIIGSMTQQERTNAVKKYNAGKVQVLFITKAGAEGLDLKGTRNVILLEKSWNRPVEEQVIGRAARYQSHTHLKQKEQHVDVYHFIMTKPKKLDKDDTMPYSADQRLQQLTEEKKKNNEQFQRLLQSVAINAPKGSTCPPPAFSIKLSPVKRSPKKSPTKRSPTKRSPTKIKNTQLLKGTCKDYKIGELRKMATKEGIKGRSIMNKQQLCNALSNVKTCKNYKIGELRKMATQEGIKGRSTMNKQQLCDALKI
jgi:SNF2 family DNA or RNA helicase